MGDTLKNLQNMSIKYVLKHCYRTICAWKIKVLCRKCDCKYGKVWIVHTLPLRINEIDTDSDRSWKGLSIHIANPLMRIGKLFEKDIFADIGFLGSTVTPLGYCWVAVLMGDDDFIWEWVKSSQCRSLYRHLPYKRYRTLLARLLVSSCRLHCCSKINLQCCQFFSIGLTRVPKILGADCCLGLRLSFSDFLHPTDS